MRIGALLLVAAGGIFLWSALHGASVSSTLRDALAGRGTP